MTQEIMPVDGGTHCVCKYLLSKFLAIWYLSQLSEY